MTVAGTEFGVPLEVMTAKLPAPLVPVARETLRLVRYIGELEARLVQAERALALEQAKTTRLSIGRARPAPTVRA